MTDTLYHLTVTSADGREVPLSAYKGRALLIVNVASKCGFTPQYAGLEALHRQYRDRGLSVLAFPCNDFGGQEPGTMEEIRQFCTVNYDVTFELFAKVHCIGENKHPLYQWLTEQATPREEVAWNFEKFLISHEGRFLQRFKSKTEPQDRELVEAVERSLPQ